MILRATTATLGLAAAALMLSGCLAPAPEPTPTPTAVFASEDEAFAAAEETYRAYVDAENARWADPHSEPAPDSFLIGEALEEQIEVNRQFREIGLRVVGENHIERVDRIRANSGTGETVLEVCIDATDSRVVDESNQDVTPANRAPQVLVRVEFVAVGDELAIEKSVTAREDGC
ncbi:hypothetical protein JNB62_09660 [Microbacterium jejuense]|uniref:Uncharacterized protein n=1 Tax=Microbacterium jejuense TaxID=1263637 RepID=A0ABS7HLY1_9MICO|nr:hypothetical protein [Microbacterium jejuense]MBW9093947.1 hypothetical protein [Microbacterium jejuense]